MAVVVLAEASPSKAYAICIASIGFVVFFGVATVIFAIPDNLEAIHWVTGGMMAFLAAVMYPWKLLAVATTRHVLTDSSVIYRKGILSRFEAEIPYRNIQAVSVKRGILQRIFGCGDVRVAVLGVNDPQFVLSHADIGSICLRAIPDFESVAEIIREKMREKQAE